jgi:uncharacterized DUF497 family protein
MCRVSANSYGRKRISLLIRRIQARQAAREAILVALVNRIYNMAIRFVWSEAKRRRNRRDHGLDFADAVAVFEGATFTFEDNRFAYGERRFVTLGLLSGIPVSIVHTEAAHEIRVISFRKATTREAELFQACFRQ